MSAATFQARFISLMPIKTKGRNLSAVLPLALPREPKKQRPRDLIQVQGLCREVSLAPEQRQQDDDRKGNTDQPKKNAFTEAHVSLLSLE
jgi:hypothetical protein